jgi:hypothetical protein
MLIPIALGLAAYALYEMHKKKVASGQASTVTGVSGTPYAVANAARSTSAVQIVDVFLLPNGTPIMEFAVTPPGVNGKKQFLSSPMQATNPILKRARQDFAV